MSEQAVCVSQTRKSLIKGLELT